jgi:3-oxoacyl-[acyl-carrier protein] reductase
MRVVTLDVQDGADHQVDVSDAEAVHETSRTVGPVDVLINSAGLVGPNVPLLETPPAEWATTFRVNVDGVLNTCQAFVPGMVERGWGRVVNMASMAGKDGNPNLSAYSASKAAVIGLTKSLGKELATTGVIVNAVAPAVFETPMNAATSPEVLDRLTSLIPMRRLGRPEELAALVAWLVSEECSFSTGSVYDISGGRATY